MKKEAACQFSQKILIFGPLEFFENENFDERKQALTRAEILELEF